MKDKLTELANQTMSLPVLKSGLIEIFQLNPIDNPIHSFLKNGRPDWRTVTPRTFTKDGATIWQWTTANGEGLYVREMSDTTLYPERRGFFTNPNIPKGLHDKGFVHLRGDLLLPLIDNSQYEVGYIYGNAYLQDDIDITNRNRILRFRSKGGRFIAVTELPQQVVLIQASNHAKLVDLIVSVKVAMQGSSVTATQHRANVMNEINTTNGQPGVIGVPEVGELYVPAIYEYYLSITDYLNAVDETAINKYVTTIL